MSAARPAGIDPCAIDGDVEGAIARISADWEALADRTEAPPWLRPGWFEAWWRAFGKGSVEIVTARRDGQLVGVVPLRRRGGGISSLTNSHTPEFGALAEDDDARTTLARALFARRSRSVALHFLDSATPNVEACSAAAEAAGYRVICRVEARSPYIPTTGALEAYLQGERPGRKRLKELRRQRRRLEAHGRVAVRVDNGHDRLEELLDTGFLLEGSSWKLARGTAIVSRSETRHFYTDVARWAAQRGSLRLGFLDVGDRPVAFELLIEEQGRLYDLKGGYDDAYRQHGPGKLLLFEILKLAFDADIRSFELLGADETYKLQWTPLVRERLLLQAFAPSLGGWAEWTTFAHGRPLAKRLLAPVQRRGESRRRSQPGHASLHEG